MKITVDNKSYEFDVERAINDGYLRPHVKRHTGQFYWHKGNEKLYIFAHVDKNLVALIAIATMFPEAGNRWATPVEVVNHLDVSLNEWKRITGGDDNFILVNVDIRAIICIIKNSIPTVELVQK